MEINQHISLLPYNTFGIDVDADFFIEYDSASDLQAVLRSEIVKGNSILHIGGGSNLLFLADYKGVILHSKIKSITKVREDANNVFLEVGSGVNWDDFVGYCVDNDWGGVENLSLIPGEAGASAVQNIGAYGVEVQEVIVEVNAVEVETAGFRTFSNDECMYGYRES